MAQVTNLSSVQAAMARAIAQKRKGLATGIKKASVFLQRESMKIVPVDYGNLRASAFTRMEGEGTAKVVGTVGYTAAYAVYVHENLDAAHGTAFNVKYAAELAAARALRKQRKGGTTGPFRHDRGPDQQAKFLEKPFRDNRAEILQIIKAEIV